jgi:hypothetical protein
MPPERAEAALDTRPPTKQQRALKTVTTEPDEPAFALPTTPADPARYNALLDAELAVDVDPELLRRLRIEYHKAELRQLEKAWTQSSPSVETTPWLTKTEAARRVGMLGASGYPTDRFYTVIRDELGEGSRVHIDALDQLVREGKL